MEILVKLFCKS